MMKTATAPSPFDATTTSSPRQRGNQRDKPSKKWRPRAEFSAEGPNHDRSKTTVVVENIPEEHFTEDEVRRFFSQFGPIVEVRMQPYKRLAIVKFETWDAANAAYKSPKVIFDNRFVKVFWFKDVDSLPTPPSSKGKRAAGAFNGAEGAVAGSPPEGVDMDEVLRKQQEAQRQFEEKTQRRQELERQRLEVEKRQRELEEKQQAEKAKLMAKLAAAGKGGAGVKDESSGDKDADAPRATAAAPSSGNPHTDALRAQLAALEEEAKSLGIDPDAPMDDAQPAGSSSYWGGYRGRGGRGRGFPYRGGRGAYIPRGGYRGGFRGGRGGGVAPAIHEAYAAYSLDNRPKKVSIVGVDFTDPKKDELLRQHLLVSNHALDVSDYVCFLCVVLTVFLQTGHR